MWEVRWAGAEEEGRTYLASRIKLDPFMLFCVFLRVYYMVATPTLASGLQQLWQERHVA